MATLLKSIILFVLGLLLVVSTNLPVLSKAIASSNRNDCPINSVNHEASVQTRAQALDAEGHRKFTQGQPYEALTCWQAADQLYKQTSNADEGLAINHLNQAQALQALGYYLQAEKLLKEKLLPKLKESPYNTQKPEFKARVLRSYGDVLRALGKLEESEKELQAIVNSENQQDRVEALISLGNTQRAIAKRARERREARDYNVSRDCKQYQAGEEKDRAEKALKSYEQAIEQAGGLSLSATTVQAKLNRLSLLRELRDSEAQSSYSDISINDLPSDRNKTYAKLSLAETLSCFNPPPDQAITQLLNEALTEAKALNDKRAQSYALGHLGHLHEIAAAEKMAKAKAAQSAKDLWLLASQQTREALLLAQAISASDIAYKWQWQLGRILKAQSREKEAITVYEETVTTLKSVRNSLLGTNADIQFSFRDDAEPIYRELADLRLSATNPDLNKAIKTIDALQVAELENFFRCALGQFVEIDKVVAEEDPDAVIIYPIILRDRLEVILTLPGKRKEPVRYSPIKLEQDFVETKLQQLLDILASSSADSKESQSLSQEFYDLLIRPAEDSQYLQPGSKASLVFVLDGGLRNIPMSALWDSKKNQYLIEKYPIAVSPGLQLLGPKRLKPQQLTALVGGLIGDNKSSFTIAGQAYGFEPLKYVGDEISKVKSILPGSHDLSLQFNHEALRQQLTNQSFPIVHLSTHGYYSSDPKQTFIVMANNQIVQLDELQGILRAGKQNRTDAIELVVLSACETATGDRRATLGMAGAAIRSGAGSILATLWQVDDESTSYLIEEFYRNLKQVIEQRKGTKAEALQAAQLALLKNSENQQWQRPYYWSPFVLLGNWL